MRLEIPTCPECGKPANGIEEVLSATAWITEPDEYGEVDYKGESAICWDSQEVDEDEEGRAFVRCANGHFWKSKVNA